MSLPPTILFAGGGTGGHIFPSLAIIQRLQEHAPDLDCHCLISSRPLDSQILRQHNLPFTALPVQPWRLRPSSLPRFITAWFASTAHARRLLHSKNITAVVAMGGFVAGPPVVAARRARVPIALVNLDAAPGRANRILAKRASTVFTVYKTNALGPNPQVIGLPLSQSIQTTTSPTQARQALGLDPDRETLLVTGGSQGAQSINQMMIQLVADYPDIRDALQTRQILHLAGEKHTQTLRKHYAKANIPAVVLPFSNQMGLAWAAATLAISRAGAGSVAEVWVTATPTIFLPYPYHKDQHQRQNAQPLADADAAYISDDKIDPVANAKSLHLPLLHLLTHPHDRQSMIQNLKITQPSDGAHVIARWLSHLVNDRPTSPAT